MNRSTDEHREYMRKYRAENAEKQKAYNQQWYAADRERLLAHSKAWKAANPERVAETLRKWKAANPELVAASARRTQLRYPERINANNNRRRARKAAAVTYRRTDRDRRRQIARQRFGCFYCGTALLPGRGTQEEHVIPISRGGSDGVGNIVYACSKCNASKHDRTITEWRLGLHPTRAISSPGEEAW